MLDMESVEVLRGPQGTLFGRNASVGAVSFHTARPKFGDFSGEVTGEIGNGDRYKASGYVNVPVGDNAAFRFAGSQQWFKGYWHNELDDKQVGGTDDTILRGSFRGEVGPVEWIFRADYAKLKGDGATNIDFDRNSVSDAQWTFFSAFLGAPDTDLNDRTMNQFLTADVDDEQWGLNSTLSWDVGGGSTVRLINNYRDWENEQLDGDVDLHADADRVAHRAPSIRRARTTSCSSSRRAEQWLDGRLDMVAGLYYFHEKYRQGERLHMNAQFCNELAPPRRCSRRTAATPSWPPMAARSRTQPSRTSHQTVDSYAAYAQAQLPPHRPVLRDGRRALHQGQEGRDRTTRLTNPFLGQHVRAAEALTFPDVNDSSSPIASASTTSRPRTI